jgi:hypothetical protein
MTYSHFGPEARAAASPEGAAFKLFTGFDFAGAV